MIGSPPFTCIIWYMCSMKEVSKCSACVYIVHVPPLSLQNTGWSAPFFAAKEGDVATTNLLLKAGANALLNNKVSSILPHRALCGELQCCDTPQSNATALDVAKVNGQEEVCKLLSHHINEVS